MQQSLVMSHLAAASWNTSKSLQFLSYSQNIFWGLGIVSLIKVHGQALGFILSSENKTKQNTIAIFSSVAILFFVSALKQLQGLKQLEVIPKVL